MRSPINFVTNSCHEIPVTTLYATHETASELVSHQCFVPTLFHTANGGYFILLISSPPLTRETPCKVVAHGTNHSFCTRKQILPYNVPVSAYLCTFLSQWRKALQKESVLLKYCIAWTPGHPTSNLLKNCSFW